MKEGIIIAAGLIVICISAWVILAYLSRKVNEFEKEMMQDYMKDTTQDYVGEVDPDDVQGTPI